MLFGKLWKTMPNYLFWKIIIYRINVMYNLGNVGNIEKKSNSCQPGIFRIWL